MEAAAMKIQAHVRGRRVRQKGGKQPLAALGEDAGVVIPGTLGNEEEEAAALKIQALQRGRAARRKVETMRTEGADIKQRILQQVSNVSRRFHSTTHAVIISSIRHPVFHSSLTHQN